MEEMAGQGGHAADDHHTTAAGDTSLVEAPMEVLAHMTLADAPAEVQDGQADGPGPGNENVEEQERLEDEDPFPPLYRAIAGPVGTVGQQGENTEVILRLLAEGADPEGRTWEGWTPLMVSGSTGQPDVMRLLLRMGVSDRSTDWCGNSAMDWTRHVVKGHERDIVLSMPLSAGHLACAELLERARGLWSPQITTSSR